MLIVNTKCKTAHFFDKTVSFLCLDKGNKKILPSMYTVSKNVKVTKVFWIFSKNFPIQKKNRDFVSYSVLL